MNERECRMHVEALERLIIRMFDLGEGDLALQAGLLLHELRANLFRSYYLK